MNIILIGPQGSGKGTQAQRLAQKYHLSIIEMGGILRDIAQQNHPRSQLINSLINNKGKLLPDGIVLEILIEHLSKIQIKKGFLFDGYPRSIKQFLLLENYLADHNQFIHLAVYLDISDQIGISRLSNRLICQRCGRVYNTETTPPPSPNTCQCNGELIHRQDDQPSAIATRLKIYHHDTQPILNLLKEKGILYRIDASQEPDKIFLQIKQIIDKKRL
jgi:adenylate kinase